jgi:hypothetical protein
MFKTAGLMGALGLAALLAGCGTAPQPAAQAAPQAAAQATPQAPTPEAPTPDSQAPERTPAFAPAAEGQPLVHVASGFSFPPRIGSFERDPDAVIQYNDAGDDVSVGYRDFDSLILATLYVYPAQGRSLADEFAARQNELTEVHPDAKLIATGNAKVTPRRVAARAATYTFAANFAGKARELRSTLLVAQSGKWFVEYRLSYPIENEAAAESKVRGLERTFAWP